MAIKYDFFVIEGPVSELQIRGIRSICSESMRARPNRAVDDRHGSPEPEPLRPYAEAMAARIEITEGRR